MLVDGHKIAKIGYALTIVGSPGRLPRNYMKTFITNGRTVFILLVQRSELPEHCFDKDGELPDRVARAGGFPCQK